MSTSLEVFADVAELTYPAMRSVLLHEAECPSEIILNLWNHL